MNCYVFVRKITHRYVFIRESYKSLLVYTKLIICYFIYFGDDFLCKTTPPPRTAMPTCAPVPWGWGVQGGGGEGNEKGSYIGVHKLKCLRHEIREVTKDSICTPVML